MSSEQAAPQTDALLIPFLNATQGSESEDVLAQLLSAHASPIIKGIIKEKLRLLAGEADLHGQDAEDVYSDVVAQILARLDSLRSDQSTYNAIQDFRAGAPIEIDALVTTVADLQGISDHATGSIATTNGEIPALDTPGLCAVCDSGDDLQLPNDCMLHSLRHTFLTPLVSSCVPL